MESKTFKIKGMHCASCASIIEKNLRKMDGVRSTEVNSGTETAKVVYDSSLSTPEQMSQKIEPLGYTLVIPPANETVTVNEHTATTASGESKREKLEELGAMKNKVTVLIPLAVVAVLVMTWDILAEFALVAMMPEVMKVLFHHLLPLFATYALFTAGTPYLLGVYRFLRYGKANMDTLIGIGTLTAFIYSFTLSAFEDLLRPFINVDATYYDVTIVLIAFITLGKYLEMQSKLKTGDAIEKLLNLQTKTALVVRNGGEVELPIQQVVHGDIIIIKPGSKIPVDGVIADGHSFIDESMISGEPIPVEKQTGDTVITGTINTTGTFTFKATKIGSETLLAHIIKMVEEAQGSKAPIQALADKISSIFVPIVLVISFISLGSWLFFGTQYLGFSKALSYGLASFVGVLVIACPCALGLATPTAIIVGVGKGAKEGILVKDAATLETLHKVTTVVVDKTGTITKGKPELVSIEAQQGIDENELISILASLEARSEHPIAQAITSYVKKEKISTKTVKDFEIIKGRGVKGTIENIEYFVGNVALMNSLGLKINQSRIEEKTESGNTPIILARKDKILGTVFVADAIKPEAKGAVAELHRLGIKVVMLSGDNRNTAKHIAREAGIDEAIGEVSPEDKLKKIKELQAKGEIVAMAGDGVNDAPALAQANVGIAMATGTDVAIESAGITLLHGDISKLVKAVHLSRFTMRGIRQNLFWAFIYNLVGIPLAGGLFYPLFGWLLNPVFAGLAMAFSSVSVVTNSLRLKSKSL
jgi:Cu+-exporting ATPase